MNDEWINNGNNTVSCPNCHSWFHLENAHYMYYCGHCGCKMNPINVQENNNYGSLIVTIKRKGNSMENRCVICGAVIQEGQQVCPNCVQKEKKSKKRLATFIPSNITAYPAEMHAEHKVMRALVEQEVVEISSKEVNGGLVYTFTFDLDKFREAPVKRRREEER